MAYSYDCRRTASYDGIARELIKSRDEGYKQTEHPFNQKQFDRGVDNLCKNIQGLKKGPADFKAQLNRIAGGLHGLAMQYGSMARSD